MLLRVDRFCQLVEGNLNGLIEELRVLTGRHGEAEQRAWQRSLPRLSVLLSHTDLADFHVHLGTPGSIALEYRLPASSSWCDAVLLGSAPDRPSAVVIELKDWDTRGDSSGPRPGLILHQGQERLHPSEQVRGYVEYCSRFHSAIVDQDALVRGCAFFTSSGDLAAYVAEPHGELTAEYPVFAARSDDATVHMPAWLARHLAYPNQEFATAFERGIYRQDRNFVIQVARSILDPQESQFVLLDNQREGFERCMHVIDDLLKADDDAKAVVVVEGPPGSGKSVLAAHLWSALVRDDRMAGNVVLTTTSGSQRSNWEHVFTRAAGGPAGKGIVIPANRYNPGFSPQLVKSLRGEGYTVDIETWQDNLALLREVRGSYRVKDDQYWVSIVDEAHALIDPTLEGKRGVPPSGWSMHAGPQAFHVIRASRLSVFLMDSEQSYRDNETTTRAQIEALAREAGATDLRFISLGDAQYRSGGSKEYMAWVEGVLGMEPEGPPASTWRREPGSSTGAFVFELCDDPQALEDALRGHVQDGATARLLASYARPWVSKSVYRPHALAPAERDFHIPFERGGRTRHWSKVWNVAPGQDYSLFVQAPAGSPMADDPLCEVGCPYVVRGFDYDWVGLLWLSDLVWRDDRWVADIDAVHESAWTKTKAAARRERAKGAPGPGTAELLDRLKRGYRILLSRAIRGMYVWFEDEETRDHVERYLAQ